MKNRALALLLAAVLMINSVPMATFAEDAPASVDVTSAETPVIPNTEPDVGSGVVSMPAEEPAAEPAIMLAAEEPQAEPCPTCGVEGCTSEHLNWCDVCEKDDCGVDHTLCESCGSNPCVCEVSIWDKIDDGEDVCLIGFLDKSAATIDFESEYNGTVSVSAGECPDYLILHAAFSDLESGEVLLYAADSFDVDFYDAFLSIYEHVRAEAFSAVVSAEGLYATIGGTGDVLLYEAADASSAYISATALGIAGEYVVSAFSYDYSDADNWFFQLTPDSKWPADAVDYLWIHSENVLSLSRTATVQPEIGCGCCEDCTGAENCDCGCINCDFYEESETTDAVSETITGANGTRLSFAVAGEGIPAGAKLEVTDESGLVDDDVDGVGIYNIKVRANGDYWQPTPGETVSVSLPVSGDVDEVTIVHLLEDPAIIAYALNKGIAQAADLSMAAEENGFQVFAAAVDAYQEATGSSDICAVVEVFEDVPVIDGKVTVEANGFSVFVSCPPAAIETGSNDFLQLPNTVFVRPNEWISYTQGSFLGGLSIENDKNDIAEMLSGNSFAIWGNSSVFIHVSPDASVDDSFTVVYRAVFIVPLKTVVFKVVPDFDYGNVYIGVIGPNASYPNEIAPAANAPVSYYYTNSGLSTSKSVYCMYPDAMIDINAVYDSNLKETNNSKTVYGVADTTGSNVRPFLRDTIYDPDNNKGDLQTFAELEADILSEYAASDDAPAGFNSDNYRVVPYVVKHETIGDNVGWYINCKIELKSTYILSYDYNEPAGFNAIDHIGDVKKPQNQSVSTEGAVNGIVTAEVDCDNLMVLTREETVGNKKNTYTATFIGWSTSKTDQTVEYAYNAKNQTIEMDGNTTLYAVWELSDNIEYVEASLSIAKIVKDSAGKPVDAPDVAFTFTPDSRLQNHSYSIYNEKGMQTKSGTLGSSFELKNGWTIIIENVPNNNTAYTISETIPAEHRAGFQTPSVLSVPINETTNKTGYISATFDNIVNTYTVTWKNADGAVLEQDTNVPYGATPAYDGATPAKEDDDKYSYTFKEWTPGLAEVSANVEYTAVFDQTAKIFTITYNLDGGTVTGNPDSYTAEDENIVLKKPTKTGYTFDGWTGTGLSGATKDVTIEQGSTGDRSYTATWTANTYGITYEVGNGGTLKAGQSNPESYTIEDEVPVAIPNVKEGYTFGGWKATDIDGNWVADRIYSGTLSRMYGDVTLTAQWKVTVVGNITDNNDNTATDGTIDNEGGTSEKNDFEMPDIPLGGGAGQKITFTPELGYEIIGVTVNGKPEENISADEPADKYTYTIGKNGIEGPLDVQVTTRAITYSIAYDLNKGSLTEGKTNPERYTIESSFKLNNPGRTGYTFDGWTGTELTEETETVTVEKKTGDREYTANWTPITYAIRFNDNADTATGEMTNLTATYDAKTALTANTFARTGYSFQGWATADNGTVVHQNQAEVLNLADEQDEVVDLYAVWTLNTFTMTITANNSEDSNQTYLFDVKGWPVESDTTQEPQIKLTVALCAGETKTIVGLPAGSYTVSDRQAWSWRYASQTSGTFVHTSTEVKTIVFTYDTVMNGRNLWLNGYSNQNSNTRKRKLLW